MSTPSELLPVSQYVFQSLTKANASFEKLIANLEALQQVSFFPSSKLADYTNVLCRLRSEINLMLVEVLSHREMSNALYYDRLCKERERELKDPDDVLFDAEQRKKQIEEEQKKKEQEEPNTGPENAA
jgi:septal ring factor EnvC (AmiA/AmiB activator)